MKPSTEKIKKFLSECEVRRWTKYPDDKYVSCGPGLSAKEWAPTPEEFKEIEVQLENFAKRSGVTYNPYPLWGDPDYVEDKEAWEETKYINMLLGIVKDINPVYSSLTSSRCINAISRGLPIEGISDEDFEKYSKIGDDLNDTIKKEKLKEDIILYRALANPIVTWIKEGKREIHDSGFMSFSYDFVIPLMYSEKIIGIDGGSERHFLEYEAKGGQTAMFIGNANGYYESEVLFSRGSSFRVKGSRSVKTLENFQDFLYVYHTIELVSQ
jgi:hypothetical protein